ncbi:serine/threonine-protein kinase [Bailinhaonella thermotolerans]|uniref:serine/threonine-protein kinase n=1 Tax=Bailinhaonella thermotolerans TaxID=1070861 RepID=UPI001A8DCC29|nr:serine/threonine-protein kinase [Bailinhaonella thermotolerans]
MNRYDQPQGGTLQTGDPASLGPYRTLARLGRGGMGTVYLAESPAGARVAVKVINAELTADPDFVARFRREVEAARKVHRFCTAPVLDADLAGPRLYVVTEYVPGPDLAAAVRQNGPLTGSNLEALAVGIATALTAIHGAGVIHRDLKPANVVLSPLGPRVIDFGIARALDTMAEKTATGKILGTPEYMAPELLTGGDVAPASDIFAWGCVVAYAATGHSLFGGRTIPEVLYRVVHETPDLSRVDARLRGVVEAALSKDPAARPGTRELLNLLVGQDADAERIAGTVRVTLPAPAAVAPGGAAAAGAEPTAVAPPAAPTAQVPGAPRTARMPEGEAGEGPREPHGPGGGSAPRGGKANRWGLLIGGGVGAVALVAAAAAGLAALLNGGPPAVAEELMTDDFKVAEGSVWPSDAVSKDAYRGFTGDGRYTMATNSSETYREASPGLGIRLPDRTLLSVSVKFETARPDAQVGVYCPASDIGRDPADRAKVKWLWHEVILRYDGNAIVRRVAADQADNELTPATRAEGFDPKRANRLQVACELSGKTRTVRLWVNGRLAVEASDDLPHAPRRVDNYYPRPGIFIRQNGGAEPYTRVSLDDFHLGRY